MKVQTLFSAAQKRHPFGCLFNILWGMDLFQSQVRCQLSVHYCLTTHLNWNVAQCKKKIEQRTY